MARLCQNLKSELCQDLDGNVMELFFSSDVFDLALAVYANVWSPSWVDMTIATVRRVPQIIVAAWWLPGLGHSKKWQGVT